MAKPTGFTTEVRNYIMAHPEIQGSMYALKIAEAMQVSTNRVTTVLRALEEQSEVVTRTGKTIRNPKGGRPLIEYRVTPKFFGDCGEVKMVHPEVVGLYNRIAMWGCGV